MSTQQHSAFGAAEYIPPDPIFEVTKRFNADQNPRKVNLGQGTYRDENAKPWVLPSVREAEKLIVNPGHEYLPIEGLQGFRDEATKLLFHDTSALKQNRIASCQSISGTGSLLLAGLVLRKANSGIENIIITDPTWSNHDLLFKEIGFNVTKAPYYKDRSFDFEGYIGALKKADKRSAVVLHACAHNPTGCDPTRDQWKEIAAVIKENGIFPIIDSAYLGFNSGNYDEDAWAIKYIIEDLGLEAAICMSFAKNMGLYGERVGLTAIVTKSEDAKRTVFSLLQNAQRQTVSNPPVYGARIAATVLGNSDLSKQWHQDLVTMSSRIRSMRKKLYDELVRLGTPGDWSHIVNQTGMFGYTGISKPQIERLEEQYHIYMANTSRISLAGLNEHNVEYVAKSLDEVVQNVQRNYDPVHYTANTFFQSNGFCLDRLERTVLHRCSRSVIDDEQADNGSEDSASGLPHTSLDTSRTRRSPKASRQHHHPWTQLHVLKSLALIALVHYSSTNAAAALEATRTNTPVVKGTETPLSELPPLVLYRSLLVNSISSRPWLLVPSLHLLQKLSNPTNPYLFNVDRNPLLRSLLKHTFYKQFCAGETGAETQCTMKSLQDMGFKGTILTFAKETVFDAKTGKDQGFGIEASSSNECQWCENIEAWREGTVKTVELLREGDQLAVKMTGAGPGVCDAFANGTELPKQFVDACHEISQKCKDRGAYILIDAESQHYQWGIFRLGMELQQKFNTDGKVVLYNSYQAYLKSTHDTLAKHLQAALDKNFTLGIKVVRGAYMASDPRSLIHDTKQDTDDSYNQIAQGVLRQDFRSFGTTKPFPSAQLLLASHNKESLVKAHETHQERTKAGLPTVPVKFAQLHGMSDEVSFGLLKLKDDAGVAPEVYKCTTWGTLPECMAYLTRRAMENRDAAARTLDEYSALKSEVWRRLAFWR
ncbi:pyridoxal phosphate-dependent transferase [Fusarium redolens]|uniref:aspartate transaminase n=1 Tax=Fusarium redolens TaxID=48865 RepID=A0A9P9G8X8_FUSRE|nr:pyridoxal phosphate-dependent transferase [Fusarium redolens]KAH7234721.1 pyridoxal phosphate-dependent transferase [Fusarium redolens]